MELFPLEFASHWLQKSQKNIFRNRTQMHVKIALNCLFLITGFKLLKLLSVVCGFGLQTYVCKNYIQNICSVVRECTDVHRKYDNLQHMGQNISQRMVHVLVQGVQTNKMSREKTH